MSVGLVLSLSCPNSTAIDPFKFQPNTLVEFSCLSKSYLNQCTYDILIPHRTTAEITSWNNNMPSCIQEVTERWTGWHNFGVVAGATTTGSYCGCTAFETFAHLEVSGTSARMKCVSPQPTIAYWTAPYDFGYTNTQYCCPSGHTMIGYFTSGTTVRLRCSQF